MPRKRHLYAASRVKRQIHRLASQHMLSTLLCCVLRRAVDAPHNGALDLLLLYKSVLNKCGFSKFVSYESSMAAGSIFLDKIFYWPLFSLAQKLSTFLCHPVWLNSPLAPNDCKWQSNSMKTRKLFLEIEQSCIHARFLKSLLLARGDF